MWTGATSGQQAIFLELGVSTLHSWCGEGKVIWVRPLMALSLGVFLGITSPKCHSSMHFLTVQGGPPPGFLWALASRKQQTFWSRTEFGISVSLEPPPEALSIPTDPKSWVRSKVPKCCVQWLEDSRFANLQLSASVRTALASPAVFLEWSLSTLPYW